MQVTILGRGRLGRSLAALLPAAGHEVSLIAGTEPPQPADVWLLTVPDGAVGPVARGLRLGAPVLHCAGALGLDALEPHPERGSLHPLMTFPGPELQLPSLIGVPAAIAGTPTAARLATQLAHDLGLVPFSVPGDRALYHAAAVLAGNLTFVCMAEAAALLRGAGVDPAVAAQVLVPIASAAVRNAEQGWEALTGPIARNDLATLRAHAAAMRVHGLGQLCDGYVQFVKLGLARRGHPVPDDL